MKNAVIAGDNADLVSQTAKELSDMLGSRAKVRTLGGSTEKIEPGDIFFYLAQNGIDPERMAKIRDDYSVPSNSSLQIIRMASRVQDRQDPRSIAEDIGSRFYGIKEY